MASKFESFWTHDRYAFVGHSARAAFPKISFEAARQGGRTVFPVDPSVDDIAGQATFPDLASLPEPVDGVVIEVPKDETAQWIERAADAGVSRVWIHMGRDTPEALAAAEARGLEVCRGTCAVQYLRGGFPHSVHKFLRKLSGNW